MKPSQSENVLKNRLGQPIERITPRQGFAAMFAFYAEQRAQDVDADQAGDMLLFQWGVYSFSGPDSFQLDITRQFSITGEDEPYQLSLTFHFAPTESLRRIEDGNRWCNSPNELAELKRFVESSAAFKAVADVKPLRVEMDFCQC